MAWQILLYHDVNWEEPRAVRGLGGTCPPDVFRAHVATARQLGDVVSPDEAARRITADPTDRVLSFWFDDGLAGVSRYAAPILAEHHLAGTVALCSQFWRREAPFWRFQLATLATLGRAAEVRAALAAAGLPAVATAPLRDLVMDAFGPPVLAALDALWATLPASERDAALHAFLHHDDIAALVEAGWTLANHTAAHHPVGEARALDALAAQFESCAAALREDFAVDTPWWVLPFDRMRAPELANRFRALCPERTLVLVGDRDNGPADVAAQVIHRYFVPPACSGAELHRMLKGRN